jgi:hypothetical protein
MRNGVPENGVKPFKARTGALKNSRATGQISLFVTAILGENRW